MKTIKINSKEYIILPQRELDVLLDDARATSCVEDEKPQVLHSDDLSKTESSFIEHLRENVMLYERIIAKQIRTDGMGVSVFKFHPRDIGGS